MPYVSSSIRPAATSIAGRQERFVAILLAVATAFGILVATARPASAAATAHAVVLATRSEPRVWKPGAARSSTEHAEAASADGLEPVLRGRAIRRSGGAETPAPHLAAMSNEALRTADLSFVVMALGESTHVWTKRARALSMVFLN